ncbi:MAG TPA: hypothetical protein VF744_19175 [Beijerinckiaceae bacterium]|jgi:hypothetical protein
MSAVSRITVGAGFGAVLAACSPTTNAPLFFAQTHTFGVGIQGSAGEQGASLVLGYKDLDIAIVPVAVTDAAGQVTQLKGSATDATGTGTNALSVLGQFNAKATTGTAPTVNLGTFFATGLAADKLADGFSAQVAKASP